MFKKNLKKTEYFESSYFFPSFACFSKCPFTLCGKASLQDWTYFPHHAYSSEKNLVVMAISKQSKGSLLFLPLYSNESETSSPSPIALSTQTRVLYLQAFNKQPVSNACGGGWRISFSFSSLPQRALKNSSFQPVFFCLP